MLNGIGWTGRGYFYTPPKREMEGLLKTQPTCVQKIEKPSREVLIFRKSQLSSS